MSDMLVVGPLVVDVGTVDEDVGGGWLWQPKLLLHH